MTRVRFDTTDVDVGERESVLDALLRAGADVPYSCRSGVCQSCCLRAVEGTPPSAAQVGLPPTLVALGHFLACVAHPQDDLVCARPGALAGAVDATIRERESIAADVVRVRISPNIPFVVKPGQYVNLARTDGLVRSYSVANLADEDGYVELHVRVLEHGAMSRWIANDAVPGTPVSLRGPAGSCVYVPGSPHEPLLLAGSGTGLAPLLGIARDALRHAHRGPIHVMHGGRTEAALYGADALAQLARAHANVAVTRCVLEGPGSDDIVQGRLDHVIAARHADLSGWRVYLCGHPDLVRTLQQDAFLAGASLDAIHADAFLTRADAPVPTG
ncbi:MAG: 2Fe-2S iron-sulfur cluster binding domain-containing protein [Planctomycetes bacterium]|nr:2Fe-2S iron-sulfur cluster binding domain-containing protein [Planctomycetota bacterium]